MALKWSRIPSAGTLEPEGTEEEMVWQHRGNETQRGRTCQRCPSSKSTAESGRESRSPDCQARGSRRPHPTPGWTLRKCVTGPPKTGPSSHPCEFCWEAPFPARGVGRKATHSAERCWRDFLDSAIPPGPPALRRKGNLPLAPRGARLGCWGNQAPLTRKRKCERPRLSQSEGARAVPPPLGRGRAAPGEGREGGASRRDSSRPSARS